MTTDGTTQAWAQFRPVQRWGFLAIIFAIGISQAVDQGVVAVLLEPIKAEFHATDAMMGLLNGFAFTALYVLLGLPLARLADRGARKVILVVSTVVWSAMTVLCGFAGSFTALALARCGVGAGEAGALAPAQSLIVDYFPPGRRTMALAVFGASTSVGGLITFLVGGGLAAAYGWRTALFVIGAPGMIVAALALLVLREPRRGVLAEGGAPAGEPLWAALVALIRKRSFVLINASQVLYYLIYAGLGTWFPAYIIRILHRNLTDIGATFSVLSSFGALVGAVVGSWATDALSRSDVRWLVWAPGFTLIAVTPAYMYAFYTADTTMFLVITFIAGFGLSAATPAITSAMNVVCGSARRTTANAVSIMAVSFIGLGIGPLLGGALSDLFTSNVGPDGLKYAMIVISAIIAPCGWVLVLSARTLERDLEA